MIVEKQNYLCFLLMKSIVKQRQVSSVMELGTIS